MTPGVLNALNRNRNREICGCGFPLPIYPGRYPSKCPSCDTAREAKTHDEDDE